jgi:hypothetical protein
VLNTCMPLWLKMNDKQEFECYLQKTIDVAVDMPVGNAISSYLARQACFLLQDDAGVYNFA